uniref:SWIRM domain-containing protein n=1 Tax=Ananas comosus var. bracteatus TaxID=296719 RepID=A0A6V7PX33_ANACO|nr:unnamed protein product [Ananas comosus var. bracteatus]
MWLAISGSNPFALDPTPNPIRTESTYQRLGVSERLHPLSSSSSSSLRLQRRSGSCKMGAGDGDEGHVLGAEGNSDDDERPLGSLFKKKIRVPRKRREAAPEARAEGNPRINERGSGEVNDTLAAMRKKLKRRRRVGEADGAGSGVGQDSTTLDGDRVSEQKGAVAEVDNCSDHSSDLVNDSLSAFLTSRSVRRSRQVSKKSKETAPRGNDDAKRSLNKASDDGYGGKNGEMSTRADRCSTPNSDDELLANPRIVGKTRKGRAGNKTALKQPSRIPSRASRKPLSSSAQELLVPISGSEVKNVEKDFDSSYRKLHCNLDNSAPSLIQAKDSDSVLKAKDDKLSATQRENNSIQASDRASEDGSDHFISGNVTQLKVPTWTIDGSGLKPCSGELIEESALASSNETNQKTEGVSEENRRNIDRVDLSCDETPNQENIMIGDGVVLTFQKEVEKPSLREKEISFVLLSRKSEAIADCDKLLQHSPDNCEGSLPRSDGKSSQDDGLSSYVNISVTSHQVVEDSAVPFTNCNGVPTANACVDQSVRGISVVNKSAADAFKEPSPTTSMKDGGITKETNEYDVQLDPDNAENQSMVPRAMRNAKKRRHGDMAYEGDADWDVLMHEQGLFTNISIDCRDRSIKSKDKSNADSNLQVFDDATYGAAAAVAAGLKARAVSPIEKIKFKDFLKRKGGLQEYLDCRNLILSHWSKDVKRILPLADCGISDSPSEDESSRDSLIREIYQFLDRNGYINTGIALENRANKLLYTPHSEVASDFELNESYGLNGASRNNEIASSPGNDAAVDNTKTLNAPETEFDAHAQAYTEHEKEPSADIRKASGITDSDSKGCKRIIVVGAGPAGLTAARHLQRQGFFVTVLEARDRIGGRVCTDRTSLSVPVDLGASIITGVEADIATERRPDPSSLICTQLGLELTVLNSHCPLYDLVTGDKVPADLDEALEAEYNSLLDEMVLVVAQNGEGAFKMSLEDGLERLLRKRRMTQSTSFIATDQYKMICDSQCVDASKFGSTDSGIVSNEGSDKTDVLSPLERRVMDWHFAHLEYGCAAMLKDVSLPHWNQDDIYGGFGGPHCMIKGGYSTVIESLGKGLDIRLKHIVTKVEYETKESDNVCQNQNKVKVCTSNGSEFVGDAVLITVPLGCLKVEAIKFSPCLPDWKQLAIQRLGFGVLNKVVLEFPEVFWDDTVDYFGTTAEETAHRGQCFMFWNVKKTVGAPVLIGLVVGKAAIDGQSMSSYDHVNYALMVLRRLFGQASVPDPVAFVVTNWGTDPFSRGAYSYVAKGASGQDYDILGRPVANCLFFAGEATCKEHPDTVGGAMLSGLREAVRIIDVLSSGKDYMAEVEAMETVQRQSESEKNEVRDLSKRLETCKFSSDAIHSLVTKEALLRDMFSSAKTTSGRLHLAKELLRLPVEVLKSFAGNKEGLGTLNSWILDSLGKNATQLLRHCVRLLMLVSTDLLAVRLSGIGRTVKEKVCVHTSRDIRAIASQLVSMWIEIFRKEKANNGGLKLFRNISASETTKIRTKDLQQGKLPLRPTNEVMDNKGSLKIPKSAGSYSPSKPYHKKSDSKTTNLETPMDTKSEANSLRFRKPAQGLESEVEHNTVISEEEAAAYAAAEAARASAIAAAKAYASSEAEATTSRELPKIPSFHKFARREHNLQMDETDFRKKWSAGSFGRQDSVTEIDTRNCKVRNWSVDFTATYANPEASRMSGDNYTQRSLSNEMACPLNLREHSGESVVDSRLTRAWVDTDNVGTGGVKDFSAIERWQSQAMDADADFYRNLRIPDEEDSNKIFRLHTVNHQKRTDGSSASQVAESKPILDGRSRVEHIKQGVVDYVASLLMPLYKTRKLDREGYKAIMKKAVTKVMEQCTEAEKAMAVYEFLDFKRKNKIRSFVDKLIEKHMQVNQTPNS